MQRWGVYTGKAAWSALESFAGTDNRTASK
jgi:hypothetical protein